MIVKWLKTNGNYGAITVNTMKTHARTHAHTQRGFDFE